MQATSELAETAMHSELGKYALHEMLAERDKLNADIQALLDKQPDPWGIKVANVEIKHVDNDESMTRAVARQGKAERERRAKIINAKGEQQAAQKSLEAAEILTRHPPAMNPRYLSSRNAIASDKISTIVFSFSMDLASLIPRAPKGRKTP